MVQMQQQQADQAREANIERNARLAAGTSQINQLFQGHAKGAHLVDLSTLANPPSPPAPPPPPPGLEGGYQAKGIPGTSQYGLYDPNGYLLNTAYSMSDLAKTQVPVGGDPSAGGHMLDLSSLTAPPPGAPPPPPPDPLEGYRYRAMPDSGGGTQYGLYDPSGNLVNVAGSIADLTKTQVWAGGDPSQTEGGFGSDFYDKFRTSILNYYLPQEDEQYANARTGLNYSLARAGSLNSSIAATDVGKLAEQDTMNRAQIASQADTQTAGLRQQVQQDQQTALNQLYSTEDPSVAANTAQNMVANANLTVPMLNPVGALFAPITAGVGNAISGFTNPYAYITGGGMMGAIPAVSTPSGSQSTGANVNA